MQPKIAAATAASAAEAPYEEEQPSGEDKAALDETYIKAAYDEDEEGDEYSDLNAFLNDDDIEGVYSDSGASLSDGEDGGESEAGGEQPGNDLSDRAGHASLTPQAAEQLAQTAEQPQGMEELRCRILVMTQSVKGLTGAASSDVVLHQQVLDMQQLHVSLLIVHEKVYSRANKPESYTGTRAEHLFFDADFTAFLTELVPQMVRLGSKLNSPTSSSIGSVEEVLFWELWNFLTSCSSSFATVFGMSYSLWPGGTTPLAPSLFAAFHSLLTCLLNITRSPAWVLMTPANGVEHRNRDLAVILMQPTTYLQGASYASPANRAAVYPRPPLVPPTQLSSPRAAAATFVPHPAQARSGPSQLHKYLDILIHLVHALFSSQIQLTDAAASRNIALFTAPSVVQFVKALVSLPAETPCTTPKLAQSSIHCLHVLLSCCLRLRNTPTSVAAGNRNAVGLPLHLSPIVSSQALETDLQLLHALGMHMGEDPSLSAACWGVQLKTLAGWKIACDTSIASTPTVTGMVQGLVGLAQQCAVLGMQQQQQPNEQSTWGTGIWLTIRNMMLLITAFRIKAADGDVLSIQSATFLPLRTSCLDPDFLAAFEASLRGQHSPTTTPEIMQASHYAWGALSLCPESVGAETLSALLSIAATIRKLMLTVMPYPTTRASSAQLRGQQQRLPVEDQPGGPTDALKRLKLLSDTQAMELTLPAAIASLNRLHAARADNGAAGPGGTTTGDSGDESPPGPGPCPEISLLQQLHAIICITFVQVFRWRVAPNASYFNNVQWLPAAGEAFQHLPNPELTTLMASAVNTTAPALAQKEVNACWERYARSHLRGQLTIGCCHLGCANLAGPSEGLLHTLACGGCRLARYCSVKCQKAAWKEGGHSTVCGKQ
ncbi:MAG: hypothetical protein WDW38_002644 [Sanguina aurantia]